MHTLQRKTVPRLLSFLLKVYPVIDFSSAQAEVAFKLHNISLSYIWVHIGEVSELQTGCPSDEVKPKDAPQSTPGTAYLCGTLS